MPGAPTPDPPARPRRDRRAGGAIVTWLSRLLIVAMQTLVGWISYATIVQPACGPWPKPDRWPFVVPVEAVTGLVFAVAWWLIGRQAREESTAGWLLSVLFALMVAGSVQIFGVLFLSFVTLC